MAKRTLSNPAFSLRLVFAALAILTVACSLTPVDVSTDEGVLEVLRREYGYDDLVEDDVCIRRPSDLDGVIVVGFFAYDAGCSGNDIFVGDSFGGMGELTPAGLARNGWEQVENRPSIALIWVDDVMLAWESVKWSENDDFAAEGVAFSPPVAQVLDDGSIRVVAWYETEAGMLPEAHYVQTEIVFDAAGNITSVVTLSSFTHEFE